MNFREYAIVKGIKINSPYLKLQDLTIDKALAVYKELIMEKCFEIIEFYDKD